MLITRADKAFSTRFIRGSISVNPQIVGMAYPGSRHQRGACPISCRDCQAFHRHQMSPFSTAEKPNCFPGLIQHHLEKADLYQMVLHRSVETTAFIKSWEH
jgi:hypothetical protein